MTQAHRPWTPSEQIFAEVGAACGLSFSAIGRMLGRSHTIIRHKLSPERRAKALAATRAWEKANPEKKRAITDAWRKAHPENVRLWRQRYAAKHSARIMQNVRRWSRENWKWISERNKAKYWADPEAARARTREWRHRNTARANWLRSEWIRRNKQKHCEYQLRRRAWQSAGSADACPVLPASALVARLATWNGRCAYCDCNGSMTWDHIVPLKSSGSHSIENLVPACRSCNSSKNAAELITWYKSKSFFTQAALDKVLRESNYSLPGSTTTGGQS